MKLMLVTATFLTILFMEAVDVYGHDACQSQRDDLNVANRNLNFAQRDVRAQRIKIRDMWLQELASEEIDHSLALRVTAEENRLKELEGIRDTRQQRVNNASAAVSRCVENDKRDCPSQCSKLHTQSVTSCECNCARWLSSSYRGCDCGPCSADLN